MSIYDFSVQVNDTITMTNPISPFPYHPGDYICDSIVLKPLVDGNNYRHFYFHPIDSIQASATHAVWVEGVGSLSLINAPGGEPDQNNVGSLTCFFKDGNSFYNVNKGKPECQSTFKPNDISKISKIELSIINNASNKTLTLTTDNFPYTLNVFNIQGQRLSRQIKVTSSKHRFNYGHLTTSLVILQVQDKNGNLSVYKAITNN